MKGHTLRPSTPLLRKIRSFISKNRSSVGWAVGLTVLSFFLGSSLMVLALRYETTIEAFTPLMWVGVFCAVGIIMAVAVLPTSFLGLITGYFLGYYALAGITFAHLIGSWLGFHVAHRIEGGKFVESFRNSEPVQRALEQLKGDAFQVSALARLSPALPFSVMNLLLVMLRIPFKPFVWAGTLGMLPRVGVMVVLGRQAQQLRAVVEGDATMGVTEWVAAGLLIVSFFGLGFYARRAVKKGRAAAETDAHAPPEVATGE